MQAATQLTEGTHLTPSAATSHDSAPPVGNCINSTCSLTCCRVTLVVAGVVFTAGGVAAMLAAGLAPNLPITGRISLGSSGGIVTLYGIINVIRGACDREACGN